MSSLEKLAIRGIRSFDSQELSVMQFYSPLTVIVGANGSGKTTIIECLKYVTTGDLPPNTKGGAFVHDPNIAGVSEVKASVKLRFFNVKREKMMVERRLQVTQKKTGNGLTMKTLEGVITFVDEDVDKKKRQTLSTKCGELDSEVPRQLGVSKAILENVIFCHQEESNWPLSEPASLKKKFDDIFEATKYTKALDAIKVLRKDQAVDIRVDKEKLVALKNDRDRSKKLKDAMGALQQRIETKSTEYEELDARIKEMTEANKTFYEQATQHSSIINKAETLETQRGIIQDNLAQLRLNFKELPDSDHELQDKWTNSERNLNLVRQNREEERQKLGDENDILAAAERKLTLAHTQQGTLLAQKERYESNLATRQSLVQRYSKEHSIPGFDHDLSETEVADFQTKLEELSHTQHSKIEALKASARKIDTEMQDSLQILRSTAAADERARASIVSQVRMLNGRVNQYTTSLEGFTVNDSDIKFGDSDLDNEKKRQTDMIELAKTEDFATQIQTKELELRNLEDDREKLHSDLTLLNKQADTRARLALKQSDLVRKNEQIETLIDSIRPNYVKFVRAEPVKNGLEVQINTVVTKFELDLEAAEVVSNRAARMLQVVETSVDTARRQVKTLSTKAEELQRQITDTLSMIDKEIPAATAARGLAEAEGEISERRTIVATLTGSVEFFQGILKTGRAKMTCTGCNRHIDRTELAEFEKYCQIRIADQPKELQEVEEELVMWNEQLEQFRKLLPFEAAMEKLKSTDIPAAKRLMEIENLKLPEVTAQADAAASRARELKGQLQEVQIVRRAAIDVTRTVKECNELGSGIAMLESELRDSGSIETTDDIQERLVALGNQVKTIKSAIEQRRGQLTLQTRKIQSMNNTIHELEMDLNGKKQKLREKIAVEKQRDEVRDELLKVEATKTGLDEKIRSSVAPLRKLESEIKQAREEATIVESAAARQLAAFNKSLESLDSNLKEINVYTATRVPQRLAACQTEIVSCETAVMDHKHRIANLQKSISNADKREMDSKAEVRNIKDNQRYRKEQRSIEKLIAEIELLDIEGAKRAKEDFGTRYNEARKKLATTQSQQAQLGGEVSVMKADLKDKEREQKTEYKDIDLKYRTELIRVMTTEIANQDLEKYGKALDLAIMTFHGHKMREINSTLKELWNKTYQGTDIDGISIESDAEAKGVSGRSYNYRVVMAKDEVKMDMRGRCSAGQKVLASIIIRLALAESFSTNCGILALDEPTTNLDKENIDALSRSLADIINERKNQTNFQLIVITHDEEFLRTLGGAGVLDKYWRVSRGIDGKTSSIERQKLS